MVQTQCKGSKKKVFFNVPEHEGKDGARTNYFGLNRATIQRTRTIERDVRKKREDSREAQRRVKKKLGFLKNTVRNGAGKRGSE